MTVIVDDSERNGRIYWEYLAGPEHLGQVAHRYGISRERVRQIVLRHEQRRQRAIRVMEKRKAVEDWGYNQAIALEFLNPGLADELMETTLNLDGRVQVNGH